jgi:hypothetical protein
LCLAIGCKTPLGLARDDKKYIIYPSFPDLSKEILIRLNSDHYKSSKVVVIEFFHSDIDNNPHVYDAYLLTSVPRYSSGMYALSNRVLAVDKYRIPVYFYPFDELFGNELAQYAIDTLPRKFVGVLDGYHLRGGNAYLGRFDINHGRIYVR